MPDTTQWTVEDHLRGQDRRHVELYRAVEAAIRDCGPVEVSVSKTTITFKGTRRGFAGARPSRHGVQGYLDSIRAIEGDARIRSVAPYTARLFVHHYPVGVARRARCDVPGVDRRGLRRRPGRASAQLTPGPRPPGPAVVARRCGAPAVGFTVRTHGAVRAASWALGAPKAGRAIAVTL